MNSTKRGPGWYWYLLPIILSLAAVIGIPVWAISSSVLDAGNKALQFKAPGEKELTISKPDSYTLFHETQATFEGRTYSCTSNLPPSMKVELINLDDNMSVPMTNNGSFSFTTSVSSFSGPTVTTAGTSVGSFNIATPGKYRLRVTGPFSDQIFSFQESFSNLFLMAGSRMLHGMAVAVVVLALALVMAIFIFMRRRAAKYASQS